MTEIVMPRLSDSMEEGTILRWAKADGDQVATGEDLVEVETDKAVVMYDSPAAGFLRVMIADGETVPIGTVIARLEPSPSPAGTTSATAPSPQTRPGLAADGRRIEKASPVARRIARELGLDLATISGSGPGGRIVKDDVEAAAESSSELTAAEPLVAAGPVPRATGLKPPPDPHAAAPMPHRQNGSAGVTLLKLSAAQRVIARRMAESRATIPDFSVEAEIDMEALVALRTELKSAIAETEVVPSINDFVVKASALALRATSKLRSAYGDDHIELRDHVNVGIAVAAPESLVVPTIFDADHKSVMEIAVASRTLIARARDGAISPREMAGGTFTVSNLGMHGIRSFMPIINPPQTGILGVGIVERRAVVHDEQLAARARMTVTLCCDHRVVYGADAAEFLQLLRRELEQPIGLLL